MKSSLFRWMCCEWLKYVELNGENILEMLFSINIFSRSFPAINLKFQHSSIEMESQVLTFGRTFSSYIPHNGTARSTPSGWWVELQLAGEVSLFKFMQQ